MATVINKESKLVYASLLKHHPKNPNKGDVEEIKKLIEHNGFYGVLIVQESTGYILIGNHRFIAGCELGIEEFPVVYLDVDEDAAMRIMLSDNRSRDIASYDEKILAHDLLSLSVKQGSSQPGSIVGTGFSDFDISHLLRDIGGPQGEAEELDKEVKGRGKRGKRDTSPKLGGMAFKIIVECDDEEQQAGLLTRFEMEGLKCKPLIS